MNKKKNLFSFGTKAETLERLKEKIKLDIFCRQFFFSFNDWSKNKENILKHILQKFINERIVVRSSASTEDNKNQSNAGAYLSLLNILNSKKTVLKSVDNVFKSYKNLVSSDQVLVQPYITKVDVSGVLTTKEIETNSPYYVIGYDDFSGKTNTITGGLKGKTIMVLKNKASSLKSERFKKLINVTKKIEKITNNSNLDIEFCINKNEKIFILQVRQLTSDKKVDENSFFKKIKKIKKKIVRKHIYSTMTDWNPAEIIGTNPKPLALSLYKYLITDENWSLARKEMGYKFENSQLLIDFEGKPYIDVNKSLRSFIPNELNERLSKKIINYQLKYLSSNNHHHDKVEFEIAHTCIDFNSDKYFDRMRENNFSNAEIDNYRKVLLKLTKKLIYSYKINFEELEKKIQVLNLYVKNKKSNKTITDAFKLLYMCKKFGTVQFSIFARHAFIANSLLRSLINENIFSSSDYSNFMNSIETVTSKFLKQLNLVNTKKLSLSDFLKTYGHLRPGTYDITTDSYQDNPVFYLSKKFRFKSNRSDFSFTKKKREKIKKKISEKGFDIDPDFLLTYIKRSIQMREYSKFIFTKGVSKSLDLIKSWGEKQNLTSEDLSYFSLNDLKREVNNKKLTRQK